MTLEEAKALAASKELTPEQAKDLMDQCKPLMAIIFFNVLMYGKHEFETPEGEKPVVIKATAATIKHIRGAILRGRIGTLDDDEEADEEVINPELDRGEPGMSLMPTSKRKTA